MTMIPLTGAGGPSGGPRWDPNGEGLCIWAAYEPRGAANYAVSLGDLCGNGNNAGDPGGAATPAWDAVNGWKPDGIQTYLTTPFVPQGDQSQTIIIQYTNVIDNAAARALTGIYELLGGIGNVLRLQPSRSNTARYGNGRTDVSVAPGLTAGNLCVAGNQGYRDGVPDGGALVGWDGAPTRNVYIGCLNEGGAGNFLACYIWRYYVYDCILTAPQVASVVAAMAVP